jgi:hypothetical protein
MLGTCSTGVSQVLLNACLGSDLSFPVSTTFSATMKAGEKKMILSFALYGGSTFSSATCSGV